MGGITSNVGLMSGINTQEIIQQLLAVEGQGKLRLQQQAQKLANQRSALNEIGSRLSNFGGIAGELAEGKIFANAIASSSNEDIIGAKASNGAQPGSYQFLVKQRASHHQILSQGFANKTSPLGLNEMSFEFGNGGIAKNTSLDDLNGGQGAGRGVIEITDQTGASAEIDLSDATTVNEVLERINASDAIDVEAAVDGDRLVVRDTSGGGGDLIVEDKAGGTTASDLGIAGTAAGGEILGEQIMHLSQATKLSRLNDGNGVLIRNNNPDLRLTSRDGTQLDVDFGRVDLPINESTKLSDLNNGNGVTISEDEENPDIKFVDRTGAEHEVNLTGVETVGELFARIDGETDGAIELSVNENNQFIVTDTTGGSGTLQVLGAGANNDDTADDLGILNADGVDADSFTGDTITSEEHTPAATTIGEIITRINESEANDGRIVASIADDGVSLELTDTTGGTGNLIVESTAANPHAAAALGIETDENGVDASTISGERLLAGLNTVLVQNINGGSGLGDATTMTVQDRAGNSHTFNNLDDYAGRSLSELTKHLNDTLEDQGVAVQFEDNSIGNGLQAVDQSGGSGTLELTGDAAEALNIAGQAEDDVLAGANLQHKYISAATPMDELNYGRGVGTGTFRVHDGSGTSVEVTISDNITNVHELIQQINSRTDVFDVDVTARINDNGDGIELVNETGEGTIKVESVNGTTAKDLRIVGEAESTGASIDGSYEHRIEFEESDNIDDVVSKIKDANLPMSVSVLNAGSGAAPIRLTFSSKLDGKDGEMLIDAGDFDFGFSTLNKAQDAKVFYGSGDPATSVLITSSTNTIDSAIEGLTLDLNAASDEVVTVNVDQDTQSIGDKVQQFVDSFNDVVGKIDEYDFFDVDEEERGLLLGNPTTSQVRSELFRLVQSGAVGLDGEFQHLFDIGIRVGSEGRLEFNRDEFEQAYLDNPQAVENLLAAKESQTSDPEEILPGITVGSAEAEEEFTQLGIAVRFEQLLDRFTDSVDGTMTRADEMFEGRIERLEDRIERFDERLERRREQLEREFTAMEIALAQLQNQGQALSSLQNNVNLAGGTI